MKPDEPTRAAQWRADQVARRAANAELMTALQPDPVAGRAAWNRLVEGTVALIGRRDP